MQANFTAGLTAASLRDLRKEGAAHEHGRDDGAKRGRLGSFGCGRRGHGSLHQPVHDPISTFAPDLPLSHA